MSKVIRIGELPSTRSLTNEDLFVVNSFVDDRTYSISWSDLLGNIKEINQPVFFSRGTVTNPSIAFVDFNAGFYSPGPGSLAITTNGTQRMQFDGEGNIDIGNNCDQGTVVFYSPVVHNCDVSFEQNVLIEGNVEVIGNIEISGELDFIGNIGVEVEGNLTAEGDVVIGDSSSGCAGFLEVYSNSTFHCDSFFEQTLEVSKNITVGGTTTTNNLTVLGDSQFQGTVDITGDVTIGGISIDASEGDLTISGDLNVGGVLSGDGAGITNLNIPGSLSFKGAIDLTTTAPSGPNTGDLYITEEGPGTVHFSFNGISGQTFQNNQFVYYTVDNLWALGSVQDGSGLVTLSGDQNILGVKTYTSVLKAFGGVDASGQAILSDTLSLTNKAVSASTVSTDPARTLTTKDYVDDRSLNAVADFPLTLGAYLSGSPNDLYDGSVAIDVSVDASSSNTANYVVARDVNGNFAANVITADLSGRADIANKVDVRVNNTATVKSYPLFASDLTPTTGNVAEGQDVYADEGFHYLPSTNTLTVSKVVADVTGNITGNADTATALETPRNLWGRPFDGTSNVSGLMTGVGDVTPKTNNTHSSTLR